MTGKKKWWEKAWHNLILFMLFTSAAFCIFSWQEEFVIIEQIQKTQKQQTTWKEGPLIYNKNISKVNNDNIKKII